MMPGSGFDVVQVEDGHCFAALPRTTTRCLDPEPLDQQSCRLISQWRQGHATLASAAWIAPSCHGAFIMERRMLPEIKERAEHAALPGLLHHR